MIRIFEAQRLISLKTIFDLSDHLESVAKGEKPDQALISKTGRADFGDSTAARESERGGKERARIRILV